MDAFVSYSTFEFDTSIDVLKTVILQPFSISTFGNKTSFKTPLRFTFFC